MTKQSTNSELRDHFAGLAMSGMLADTHFSNHTGDWAERTATAAYTVADAMMAVHGLDAPQSPAATESCPVRFWDKWGYEVARRDVTHAREAGVYERLASLSNKERLDPGILEDEEARRIAHMSPVEFCDFSGLFTYQIGAVKESDMQEQSTDPERSASGMPEDELARVLAAIKGTDAEALVTPNGFYRPPLPDDPRTTSSVVMTVRNRPGPLGGGVSRDGAHVYAQGGFLLTFINDNLVAASRCVNL